MSARAQGEGKQMVSQLVFKSVSNPVSKAISILDILLEITRKWCLKESRFEFLLKLPGLPKLVEEGGDDDFINHI